MEVFAPVEIRWAGACVSRAVTPYLHLHLPAPLALPPSLQSPPSCGALLCPASSPCRPPTLCVTRACPRSLIDSPDGNGLTPLHHAVWAGRHATTSLLCDLGAKLGAKTAWEATRGEVRRGRRAHACVYGCCGTPGCRPACLPPCLPACLLPPRLLYPPEQDHTIAPDLHPPSRMMRQTSPFLPSSHCLSTHTSL